MLTSLTGAQLRRARVLAQGLGVTPRARSVPAALAATMGIQAQDLAAAALSIRPRAAGASVLDVFQSVANREAVLIWSVRGTRHLHAAQDVQWLVSLLGPVLGRQLRRERQLGIDGEAGDRAVVTVRDALAAGPLTREEIKALLAGVPIDVTGQAPVHVLYRAAMDGILVIIPDPHGPERYGLLDSWVAPGQPMEADAALARLARRYLGAFGPASPADFRAWSGLPLRLARQGWESIAAETRKLCGPAGPLSVLADQWGQILLGLNQPAPLRLLGGFDTLLLGYHNRGGLLAPEQARRVNAGGGMVAPVILDDAQVVGTWHYRRTTTPHRIEVSSWAPLDPLALQYEANEVGRFLGTEPVVVRAS